MEQKKKEILMTSGPIYKQIIIFTIPLLLGNVFQQLYNTVDSVIVGRFVDSDALAAVGSSGSIIHLLVGFLMGIGVGGGVVISQYFGAKQVQKLKDTVHTTVAFSIIGGIILGLFGVIFTPTMLRWMGTPDSVFKNSVLYLRIIFGGVVFTVLYNMGSGILRAVGDSKRPLYYLIITSILNIFLDLLFVAVFKWRIAGAAIATVLSQMTSTALTFWTLTHENADYRVELRKIKLHMAELKKVIAIGLPSGLQNSIISLSNVVIQSSINSFGALAVAGCGSYSKLDGLAILPSSSFAMALTTFVGQNIGAKKYDRIKKGTVFGLISSMLIAEAMGAIVFLFAPHLISIFNDDPQVIYYGQLQARNIVLFYFMLAFSHGMAGILRGAGLSKVPMFIMTFCWCGLRLLWIAFALPLWRDIRMVFWAYPITWAVGAVVLLFYFLKVDWMHRQ